MIWKDGNLESQTMGAHFIDEELGVKCTAVGFSGNKAGEKRDGIDETMFDLGLI